MRLLTYILSCLFIITLLFLKVEFETIIFLMALFGCQIMLDGFGDIKEELRLRKETNNILKEKERKSK